MSVIPLSSNKDDTVCMVPDSSLMMMISDKKCASGYGMTDTFEESSIINGYS